MKTDLKIISAYKGMLKYVEIAKVTDKIDRKKMWSEFVIEPYWNEWAAGQFNEDKMKQQLANPIQDIDRLEHEVKLLMTSNIEQQIEEAFQKIFQILPSPEPGKTVCIYVNTEFNESVHGVVGSCVGDNILIQVNPVIIRWQNYLPWVLAHEHHHCIWGYNYYYLQGNGKHDFLTAIITEGEADSFGQAICPDLLPPLWVRVLSIEQELEQWNKLKEFLSNDDSMELHNRFFFGDAKTNTPPSVGYTIGFNIVQSYVKYHPEISFIELVKKDAHEILYESGYNKPG